MDCIGFYIGLLGFFVVDAQTTAILRASDDVQHFTSPGYPYNYTFHLDSKWIITATSGKNIQLIVTDSDIEWGLGCLWDAAYVYDGSYADGLLLGKFCGKEKPSYVSSGNIMTVAFITDGAVVGKGFRMSYQSGTFDTCGHKKVTSVTTPVQITSPFYPNSYPSDTECTWSINTADSEYIVLVSVDYLDIEYTEGCSADYLQVFDGGDESGSSLGKWCGKRPPPITHSSGKDMFIKFHSNSKTGGTGFKLEYRSSSRSYYYGDSSYYNSGAIPGGISTGLVFFGVIIFAIVQRVRKRSRDTEQRQIRLASILESSQQSIYTIGRNNRDRNFDPSTFAPPPTYDDVMSKEPRPETPPPTYESLNEMYGANMDGTSSSSEVKVSEDATPHGPLPHPGPPCANTDANSAPPVRISEEASGHPDVGHLEALDDRVMTRTGKESNV